MVLPPVSDGISYSNIQPADEEQLDDKSESARGYTLDVYRKTDTTYHHPASARTVYPLPSVDHHPMLSRTSIDVYGAFDGDGMPRVDEPSRTMQLAYTDPCKIFDGMTDSEAHSVTSDLFADAQIRHSLMNASNVTQSTHIPGIFSGPPAYAGYRQH